MVYLKLLKNSYSIKGRVVMLSFLKGEANLILRNLLKNEKDVIITYETHNNNDVVAICWECDDICF